MVKDLDPRQLIVFFGRGLDQHHSALFAGNQQQIIDQRRNQLKSGTAKERMVGEIIELEDSIDNSEIFDLNSVWIRYSHNHVNFHIFNF